MFAVKDYLTDETVAYTTRKEDAVAMIRNAPDDKKLIVEKVKKDQKRG